VSRKKIAIGTWAYIWGGHTSDPVPLTTVLRHVRAAGFDGVELAGFTPHMHPGDFPTQAKRKDVKKMLDDHGLEVASLAANFRDCPPALARPTDYVEVVQTNLDICHDLGIPNLRVDTVIPSGQTPDGTDLETCFWRLAQTWHRAASVCAREGVRMVWEFEAAFLFNKPSEVIRLVHAVDHPNFSVLFDVFHAYMCGVIAARQTGEPEILPGGVVQFAHMLTGKIGLVHFIDCESARDGNDAATGRRTLSGGLDLDGIVRAVLAAGYTGEWWSIDLGAFWPDALADTGRAKHFMDSLAARSG
jgi:sugar phosphate isomerase/epimerase